MPLPRVANRVAKPGEGELMAEDRTLLQSQKNKVAGLVSAAGFAPSAFTMVDEHFQQFPCCLTARAQGSRFYYEFAYFTNQYEGVQPMALYSPGEDSREVQHELGEWDEAGALQPISGSEPARSEGAADLSRPRDLRPMTRAPRPFSSPLWPGRDYWRLSNGGPRSLGA
jgi:hypothetical protein